MSLLVFSMSVQNGTTIGMAVLLVIFAVAFIFRRAKALDDRIEGRRGNAVDMVALCQDFGLDRAAGVAKAYAIGDYDGLYQELKQLAKDMLNPATREQVLANMFFKQLPARVRSAADRAKIMQALAEADAGQKAAAVGGSGD